jgi:hypothetical protein
MHLHVGSVLRLEEHDRGPVVGLVLNEAARCARRKRSGILTRIHGNVESIASDDLMKMRSVLHARVDQRISSLDDELRACKSKHVALSSNILRKGCSGEKSGPLHRD